MAAPPARTGDTSTEVSSRPAPAPGTEVDVHEPAVRPGLAERVRHVDRKLLLASLVIATGLVMIGFALMRSVTGREAADLPLAVEVVDPSPSAVQVLQQGQVVADLVQGYEGRLIIDGVELVTVRLDEIGQIDVEPGEQVEVPPGAVFEPGNATLKFTPRPGAPIERFEPGTHNATVIYWKAEEGPERGRSFSWSFNVA